MAYYNYYTTPANQTPELAVKLRQALETLGLTVETLDFTAQSGNFVLANDASGNEIFKWSTNNIISVCGQDVGASNLMTQTSPISIAATAHAVCLMSAQGSNPSPCREVVIIAKSGSTYMGFAAWTGTEGSSQWDYAYIYNMSGESQSIISVTPIRNAGNPICAFSLGTLDGQYLDKCYWCVYAPPAATTSAGTVAGTPCVLINGYVLMME